MRLVDADALFDQLTRFQRKLHDADRELTANQCIAFVENAPTVDAVQVVRCVECRHWGKDGFGDYRKCSIDGAWHKPLFYCASGERREEH